MSQQGIVVKPDESVVEAALQAIENPNQPVLPLEDDSMEEELRLLQLRVSDPIAFEQEMIDSHLRGAAPDGREDDRQAEEDLY